jgi:hypothetical protein
MQGKTESSYRQENSANNLDAGNQTYRKLVLLRGDRSSYWLTLPVFTDK